ncbi:MAG: hypothetical protein Q4F13_15935 [Pseudomonadota bacterium]|nr:hypothetical protein [Pseudomonadota bacterium]
MQIIIWGSLFSLALVGLFILTLPIQIWIYWKSGDMLDAARPIMEECERLLGKVCAMGFEMC